SRFHGDRGACEPDARGHGDLKRRARQGTSEDTRRARCPAPAAEWPAPLARTIRRASVPVVDLDVVRVGRALPGLHQRLQTQQENRPLGAAVVHELHRLLPTLVLEEDDGEVTFPLEIEANLRADPL